MTKEDFFSVFIYVLMAAVLMVVGFTVVRPAMEQGLLYKDIGLNLAFLFIALIIGIFINVFSIEFGHLFGALIGGYNILSFNILGFCFFKEEVDGVLKTKFKFKSFNGFMGETIVAPKKEKSNPMFYVFLPLAIILLQFVALNLCMILIADPERGQNNGDPLMVIKYGMVIVATIGGCFALYNYFPAKLDVLNDGYRLVLLNKKINVNAYNEKLRINECKFFNKEVGELKVYDEITDFTAQANLETSIIKFNEGKGEEALDIIDKTMVDPKKMSRSTYNELLLNKTFINFLTKDLEEAINFYKENIDEDNKNYIRKCKDLLTTRLYVLYVGLAEKSASEIAFAVEKENKLLDRLNDGEKNVEESLFNKAILKVYEVYPNLRPNEKGETKEEPKEDKVEE